MLIALTLSSVCCARASRATVRSCPVRRVGKATDNDKLVAEGKADQLKASAKKVRDDAKDGLTG